MLYTNSYTCGYKKYNKYASTEDLGFIIQKTTVKTENSNSMTC
jgi:hypothetical protein